MERFNGEAAHSVLIKWLETSWQMSLEEAPLRWLASRALVYLFIAVASGSAFIFVMFVVERLP